MNSLNSVVRVQLAQRRIRNNENSRGGFNNRGHFLNNSKKNHLCFFLFKGFRGGRNNWNNNNSRPGGSNHWNSSRDSGGFRGKFPHPQTRRISHSRNSHLGRGNSDRGGGGSYRGNRDNNYRGSNRDIDDWTSIHQIKQETPDLLYFCSLYLYALERKFFLLLLLLFSLAWHILFRLIVVLCFLWNYNVYICKEMKTIAGLIRRLSRGSWSLFDMDYSDDIAVNQHHFDTTR